MRNIYVKEIIDVQQGCIFDGAVADGFEGCPTFGLIITPRCDIAQHKVPTVHYLPIVRFDDWKRVVLVPMSQSERIRKSYNELIPLLKKSHVPVHLAEKQYKLSDEDLSKSMPYGEVGNCLKTKLKKHWKLQDVDHCYSTIAEWKQYSSKIAELVDGKMERYLLLEDWEHGVRHYVICLTEIYHLVLNDALKLKDGLKVRDINFSSNDLFQSHDSLTTYSIKAQLSSPYIEYVIQKMSNAFFRIGIEDWEDRKAIIEDLK